MAIRPLGDRVVLKPVDREERDQERHCAARDGEGEAAGGDRRGGWHRSPPRQRRCRALGAREGDRVLYAKYAGNEFKIDEVENT